MQKARRHAMKGAPTACRRMVSGTLSLFCPKCFSPFPHGTGTLSVSGEYLALPDGPGGFTQDSTCPALLRSPLCFATLRVRGSHPLRPDFPDGSARDALATARSYYPAAASTATVWALPRSLATTGGIIVYFLFLRVLRCFSSPRWPHYRIIVIVTKGDWVVPFGDRGIKGRLRLPRDYRSLPRPSSPPGAKASAMRPFLLSSFSRSALPPRKNGGKRAHTSSSRCMVSFSLAIRLL